MDDHQFDYIAIFTAKNWLNFLMDDHKFDYMIAIFTAEFG
jgi:hypothetical protein